MRTLCISLPETPERTERAKQHFTEIGLTGVHFIDGIHAETFGLLTHHPYNYDHPGTGFRIPGKHVGLCLSHFVAWSICKMMDEPVFMILEDDALFCDDWKERLDRVTLDQNIDMLLLGSCNCAGKPRTHIEGEVYDVRWPQCTHAYIVTRKGIEILLATQRDIFAPIDLALIHRSYDKMTVRTVLPRIVSQYGQEISE